MSFVTSNLEKFNQMVGQDYYLTSTSAENTEPLVIRITNQTMSSVWVRIQHRKHSPQYREIKSCGNFLQLNVSKEDKVTVSKQVVGEGEAIDCTSQHRAFFDVRALLPYLRLVKRDGLLIPQGSLKAPAASDDQRAENK